VSGSSGSVDHRRPAGGGLTTVILVLFASVWFGPVVVHGQSVWNGLGFFWNDTSAWQNGIVPTGTAEFGNPSGLQRVVPFFQNTPIGEILFDSNARTR
jgi:hypothetical protein